MRLLAGPFDQGLKTLSSHIFTSFLKTYVGASSSFSPSKGSGVFEALFFSGDRAADLALVKTQEFYVFQTTQISSSITFGRGQGDQNVLVSKKGCQ